MSISIENILLKDINEKIGNLTIKQCVKQLQKLDKFTIFYTPVIQQYPELKDQYLSIIKQPISLRQIMTKINAKDHTYNNLLEILQQLDLITQNARQFNPNNNIIEDQCQQFETSVIFVLNQALKLINVEGFINFKELQKYAHLTDQQIEELYKNLEIQTIDQKGSQVQSFQYDQNVFISEKELYDLIQQLAEQDINILSMCLQQNLVVDQNNQIVIDQNDQQCQNKYQEENRVYNGIIYELYLLQILLKKNQQIQEQYLKEQNNYNLLNELKYEIKVQFQIINVQEIKQIKELNINTIHNYFPKIPSIIDYKLLQMYEYQFIDDKIKIEEFQKQMEQKQNKILILFNQDKFESQKQQMNVLLKLKPNNLTRIQICSLFLDDELIPKSFTQIGHIAQYNLQHDEQLKFKFIIGQSTIIENKQIKTVVNKIKEISDVFRTTPIELIGGEQNYLVKIKHCGVFLQFDYQKVYWNTRLDTAHQDVINYCIKNCQNNHYIVDLTCGVGPFSVPLIKQNKLVISNDLNPDAIQYLKQNSIKWKNNITIYNEDGQKLIQNLLKQNDKLIDIVIVNLPELSLDLIKDCCKQQYQYPTYIIECFSNEVEFVQQSIILRLIGAQYGWQYINNIIGIKININESFGNDSIIQFQLIKNKIENIQNILDKIKDKYFEFYTANIVRDVSPSKYYCKVICKFKNIIE